MVHEADTHPLIDALSQIAHLHINADVGTLTDDYFSADHWVDDDITFLDDALVRQAADHPTMDKRTQASYFINDYTWYMPVAALASYLITEQVPDVSRENIGLRRVTFTWEEDGESGEAERLEVRYLSGRFACLPDDAAASHPDAVVLKDKTALLEWLRTRIESHMQPIIERVHRLSKLPISAQWRLVADSCAGQLVNLGRAIGEIDRAQKEGLALIKAAGSPLNNPQTGYITLTCAGHTDTFRERGGCCRYYTVSEDGDYCGTCVLRDNRKQWFLDHMKQTYT